MYVCMRVCASRRARASTPARGRTHTRGKATSVVPRRGGGSGRAREPTGQEIIKQQDNDGDLRGSTANGLTRRIFTRAARASAREKGGEAPRAIY